MLGDTCINIYINARNTSNGVCYIRVFAIKLFQYRHSTLLDKFSKVAKVAECWMKNNSHSVMKAGIVEVVA